MVVIIGPGENIRWKFPCQSKVSFWKKEMTPPWSCVQARRGPALPNTALGGSARGGGAWKTERRTSIPPWPGSSLGSDPRKSHPPMMRKLQGREEDCQSQEARDWTSLSSSSLGYFLRLPWPLCARFLIPEVGIAR